MKKALYNWLYTVLERLLLLVDGRAPTKVRIKAVKPVTPSAPIYSMRTMRLSERERMRHHCVPQSNMLPWEGGTWYCSKCRTMRTYVPLTLPREEATTPHYIPRVRGRHNGHLRYTTAGLIDTGKFQHAGGRI